MSTLTDADLMAEGLSTDMLAGFRAQMKQPARAVLWPDHFQGPRIDKFVEGCRIAKNVAAYQRGRGRARRTIRAEERRTQGMMTVMSVCTAAERRAEQLEALRAVLAFGLKLDAEARAAQVAS